MEAYYYGVQFYDFYYNLKHNLENLIPNRHLKGTQHLYLYFHLFHNQIQDYEKIGYELTRVSPPLSSKLSRVNQAARAFQWEKEEMRER